MSSSTSDYSSTHSSTNDSNLSNSSSETEDYSDDDDDINMDYCNQYIGKVLNDKYLLIYEIGSGSFATVWIALDLFKKRYYAIKIQNSEDFDSGLEEIKVLRTISEHKCEYLNKLVEKFIYELDNGKKNVCMVFELMAGSVFDIMKDKKFKNGFKLKTVKKIVYQLLVAMKIINLEYKLIHTDIKPENMLVVGRNLKIDKLVNQINSDKRINSLIDNLKKNKNIEKSREDLKNSLFEFQKNNIYQYKNDDEKNLELIDNSYIENIKIKLSDFGNCKEINHKYYDIQTRYYRAPEIILEYPFNETCDVWSVACVIFELLTGEILFNPDKKNKKMSSDRYHLCEIISISGKIPSYLLDKAKKKDLFFRRNGLLRGIFEIKYNPLHNIVTEKFKNRSDFDVEQINLTSDLMYRMFVYDPKKRISIENALKHPWFQNIN